MIEMRRRADFAQTSPLRPHSTHRRPWMGRRCTKIRPFNAIALFWCRTLVQKLSMIYGYARISTDGQSVTAQVAALRKHGAGKVFREVASGAKADRPQLRRLLDQLEAGDVLRGRCPDPPPPA